MTLTMMNTTGMEVPLPEGLSSLQIQLKGIDLSLSCVTVLFMEDYRMRT